MTGRRVQTGLELSKRSKQNLPPWRQCQRAAGARAESCHYTVSLSARDTTRHGGIRAARRDNSFINTVITVIRIVVGTIIVVIKVDIVDKCLLFYLKCLHLFIYFC